MSMAMPTFYVCPPPLGRELHRAHSPCGPRARQPKANREPSMPKQAAPPARTQSKDGLTLPNLMQLIDFYALRPPPPLFRHKKICNQLQFNYLTN